MKLFGVLYDFVHFQFLKAPQLDRNVTRKEVLFEVKRMPTGCYLEINLGSAYSINKWSWLNDRADQLEEIIKITFNTSAYQ